MKKLLNISGLIIGIVLLTGTYANAQYALKLGDDQYNQYNYIKAAEFYQQAYDKKESLHAAERLADCYRLTHNYAQAETWYAKVVNMPGSSPENVLKYAAVLRNNSKFMEAKEQYTKYSTLNKKISDEQLQIWTVSCDSALVWVKNPTSVTIKNESKFNSAKSDWGAVMYGTNTVFSSDRPNEQFAALKKGTKRPLIQFNEVRMPSKTTYGWTGNSYLRLYQSNGTDSTKLFPITAGTDYHIGSASFTANGNEIYFTLTRIPGKSSKGDDNTIYIEIYSSKRDSVSGKWGAPVPFKYNNISKYSVGDPFITPDGQTLYFVSTMPGGKGGTDMYYCEKQADGKWGSPINIEALNTPSNERTPVLDKDGSFYYSSDGSIGIGGLDIFKSSKSGEAFTAGHNMGSPLNTPQDDFAYIKTSPNTGYFSSDRPGGSGSDDIYSFVEMLMIKLKLEGIVYDKNTLKPVPNALVSLTKAGGGDIKVTADADGKYAFDLAENSDYSVHGEKPGYSKDSLAFTTVNIKVSQTIKKDLNLAKGAAMANSLVTNNGDNTPPTANKTMVPEMNSTADFSRFNNISLNQPMRVGKIYYDFDRAEIRPDAARELDKLVKIMKDYPNISIELGSYTDSRGVDVYNLDLSQRRANSAVAYIVNAGIEKERITAQGYGETGLVNKCANGVNCTPYQHQLNRRTEVKVVKK